MANVLPFPLRVKIIGHLVEGISIRATGRLCETDKDAVMRLGLTIGLACLVLHARLVRGVRMSLGEVDEVWAYVGRHQRRLRPTDPAEFGDNYTLFCMDSVTKLVPSFLTGRRDGDTALAFALDLRKRVVGKPQISVDGWIHWPDAFRKAFGWNGCDLGACIKEYQNDIDPKDPARKYSPGKVKRVHRHRLLGMPVMEDVSTALAERVNLTTRMQQRRLTRLTNAFSKKAENLTAAMALHFFWYNFVRVHETIGTTPAHAAGLTDGPWSLADLVAAALDVAAEEPGAPEPTPGPSPTTDTDTAPLPTWETWVEPVQLGLPGLTPANDNATPAVEVDEDEGPATVRDLVPWSEAFADWGA